MTSAMPKSLDDLTALLEERARYERWIAQLTAKREQTPSHVYDRVRSDYSSRLDTVMGQLRSRGEWLQSTASSLEEQTAALASEESLRRDARAEIELRAMVGEYSDERASNEIAACDADIARLESDRTAAMGELGRLQEILALIRAPEAPAAAPPAPPPTLSHAPRPLGAPVPPEDSDSTFNELAFLNSVVERRETPPGPKAAPVVPPPRAVEDIPMVTSFEATDRSAPRATPVDPQTIRQTAGTPAFLKGMPTEQVKTLKCQECGTMNYPTEWYCERCGGELAAM